MVFFFFLFKKNQAFDTHKTETLWSSSPLEQLCIEEGPGVLRSFSLRKAELGFFHFLEIVTG